MVVAGVTLTGDGLSPTNSSRSRSGGRSARVSTALPSTRIVVRCGPGPGRRVRASSSSGVMRGRVGSTRRGCPAGSSASAQAGRSSPVSVGSAGRWPGLDLGLRLGRLGLRLLDAPAEGRAPFRQRLRAAHDEHADQDDDQDDQDVGPIGRWYSGRRGRAHGQADGGRRSALAAGDRDDEPEAVWVAENEPTLLSTRPGDLARPR